MMLPATDRFYDTFWRQSVRWLAVPAADPVTVIPPESAGPREDVAWRVMARNAEFEPLRDATVDLRVTGPDGRLESLVAVPDPAAAGDGAFVARHRPLQRGVYRATAEVRRPGAPPVVASASALVGGADSEMADPRLNLRVLQRIAAATGGRVIDVADLAALPAQLRAAVPAATIVARRDLWHTGWSFGALVLLLAAEWLLRRRWGMR
jgi:hypothetical protein